MTEMLTRHTVTIFIGEQVTDSRGDVRTRPSTTAIETRATLSPRITAADRVGTDLPRWSLLAPPDVVIGKWSRVVAIGREFAVTSWPRLVGPDGSAAQHVEAELIEVR